MKFAGKGEINKISANDAIAYLSMKRHRLDEIYSFDKHGSTARGLHGKWRDIDLVVIADFNTPFIDRIGKLLELNETRAPIEPLGYTPKEFNAMLLKLIHQR